MLGDFGWVAPLLLVLVRCVQGLSTGGQLVGSFLFTVESAPAGYQGTFGAIALVSQRTPSRFVGG